MLSSFGVEGTMSRVTAFAHVKSHPKMQAIVFAIKKGAIKKRIGKTVRKAVGKVDAARVKAAIRKAKKHVNKCQDE